jgi:hypothetical protein
VVTLQRHHPEILTFFPSSVFFSIKISSKSPCSIQSKIVAAAMHPAAQPQIIQILCIVVTKMYLE